jgi:dipeptidyl aminopeptidase/acylaminoacyl peptidase
MAGARPTSGQLSWLRRLAAPGWVAALAALTLAGTAQAAPLEVYGRLPSLEQVSLSPDGTRIAFVKELEAQRVILIQSLPGGVVLDGMRLNDTKVRRLDWADDDHLLITTSTTTWAEGLVRSRAEWFHLEVRDVAHKHSEMVPNPSRMPVAGTKVMTVIAGDPMVRRRNGHAALFVPGIYVKDRTLPALVEVDLDSGQQKVAIYGSTDSLGWLVDADGKVVAEQDYSEKRQRWSLSIRHDKQWREVAGGPAAIAFPRLLGFGPENNSLLMQTAEHEEAVWKLLSLKDGTLGPALAGGKPLESPIEDRATGRVLGGSYWDDIERYVFFEAEMQAHWDAIVRAFAGDHVRFVSASADFKKILVQVDGPKFGDQYQLVDLASHQALPVGAVYEGIAEPLEMRRIDYPASDQLQIPAYLTLPPGRIARSLPLVVLVHGGPAARDEAHFDWWSQALADQGYAVLRSNYRGSTVSARFMAAGFGELGRKMQTDLSDGVRYLVKEGIADPARVCIVGASYGGYAALAGATLDSGVYRCAVSVAGVSDLGAMLKWVDEKHRDETSRAQRFWDRFIGATGPKDPVLDLISPIKHAQAATAPVLLIHGKDDTVVPYDQSDDMADALRHAGKTVEFVKLKHEDHWLSRGETRLQMLQATVAFLRKYNPPD